jgi:death on curing protein
MAWESADVAYLDIEDVLEAYAAAVGCPPEVARDQLRSRALLESALGRPRSYAFYQQADIALQAAVLAHGIAENQPFVDGNKRTAEVAMLGFLVINGYDLNATEEQLVEWMLALSESLTAVGLAEQLRRHLVDRKSESAE